MLYNYSKQIIYRKGQAYLDKWWTG